METKTTATTEPSLADRRNFALRLSVTFLCLAAALFGQQAQPAPQPGQPRTAIAAGRPPIQTKTPEEYQAYQVAIANEPNPEAMEKAADDFAARFPTSEVRVLLYRAAMSSYQNLGNPQKMMDMGMKVLAIDKDDPEALVGVAEVLEERTSPTDLDRQQRETQVIEYATHALKTIDTDLAVPAGTAPERVDAYKRYLRSTALAIIGTIYYKQENFPDAEMNLRSALQADPSSTDPVVVLRLALVLDQEKKYSEALEQANRAVQLSKEGTDLARMASRERDRLVAQLGTAPATPAAATASPAASQPNAPAAQAPAPASATPSH